MQHSTNVERVLSAIDRYPVCFDDARLNASAIDVIQDTAVYDDRDFHFVLPFNLCTRIRSPIKQAKGNGTQSNPIRFDWDDSSKRSSARYCAIVGGHDSRRLPEYVMIDTCLKLLMFELSCSNCCSC